jgi:hypothetical protein
MAGCLTSDTWKNVACAGIILGVVGGTTGEANLFVFEFKTLSICAFETILLRSNPDNPCNRIKKIR